MIAGRLTSKAQTTIPKPVREALGLKGGDRLLYEIADGAVLLRRAAADLLNDPFATFSEWDGEIDRKAYADL